MRESELQALCVEYLRKAGWFAYIVSRSDRRTRGMKGVPDIYAHRRGRSMWVEVKTDKGLLRPEQSHFRAECLSHGIEHHVVRSLDELMEVAK